MRRRSRRRRGSFLLALPGLLIKLISVLSAVALCFALVSQFVSPETTTFFAFFALAAPLIFMVNILLLLVWIIRWKPVLMIIVGVPVAIGAYNLSDFVQVKWTRVYGLDEKTKGELTVLTYNTHRMGTYNGQESRIREICDTLHKVDADVVFFQEFCVKDSAELSVVDSLFQKYAYRTYQFDPTKSLSGYRGIVTISKYQIVDREVFKFPKTGNGFVRSDVIYRGDTLSLFNCHLQTTTINQINQEKGMRDMLQTDTTIKVGEEIMDRLSKNFVLRAHQVDSLKMEIEKNDNAKIVAGDFNSPPLTYTYSTVSSLLQDSFFDGGSGYGSTYKPLFGFFRLDYIFYDDDRFDCEYYESPSWIYSDHKPVIITLSDNEK